jgi:hypothetical protein
VLRLAAFAVTLSAQAACNGPSASTSGGQRAAPPAAAQAPAPAPTPPSPAAAPAPAPAAPTATDRCRITASEAASTLGIPRLREPRQIGDGPVTVCQYNDGRNQSALRIYYQTGSSKSSFATAKKAILDSKQKPTPVAGLGEMAFSTKTQALDKEFNMIVFLHEGTQTSVMAPAPLAKVKQLALQIIAKL